MAEERKDLTHEVNHCYILFMVNVHYCKLSLQLWTLFIIYLQMASHVMNSEMHQPSINTEGIYQTPETNKIGPSLLILSHSQLVQTMKKLNFFHCFLLEEMEDTRLFVEPLDSSFGLLVMSALGVKARVDSLPSVLHHLHATYSLDPPLMRHLLTSWRPAWRSRHFDPRTWPEY